MKQNYNTPVFILESDDNMELPSSEAVSAAFKAVYPTYKEARLFVLNGGVCFFKVPSSSSEGAYEYSKFDVAGLMGDYVTYGKVGITFFSHQVLVEYSEGGGGGLG